MREIKTSWKGNCFQRPLLPVSRKDCGCITQPSLALNHYMSIEMEPLVRLSTNSVDKQDDCRDPQVSDDSVYENLENPSPLTSRSDPGTEHNKPQFVKAHRRGGSYIPGGYNFAATNTKVPLPKSKLEQLGSAFPAKKIEVASLAIKSATQRSSVLHIERSISSPLPAVSSHLMRPSVGRWRPNSGLHDIDVQRQSNSQYIRPALSNGSGNRNHIGATKPRPKAIKQEETEENSRRKTVTWCELTEVHEFVHTDSQSKEVKPGKANDQPAKIESNEDKPKQDSKVFKDDPQVFVKDISFGNQSLPPLDMSKLEIVSPSQLSKCVDTDSDISISSPSSEDSMPFTDAPEVPEVPEVSPVPETQQYKRSSRISRDDVLSRLAELKKNRSEEDAFEPISLNKDKSILSEADQIVENSDDEEHQETSEKVPIVIESSSVIVVDDQRSPQTVDKLTLNTVEIPETKLAISDRFTSEENLESTKLPSRPNFSSGIPTKPKTHTDTASTSRPMDLSEWYKQRKRMERVRREQVQNGKYDFDMDDVHDDVQNEKDNETPVLLSESSRRATYTEGVTNMISLTATRPGAGFEKSLLEDFERIAEGQKPKGYRERRISKVVVASSDFEKAGGADQAIADAFAFKNAKIKASAEVLDAYDDSAQSIHSIASTANFAPRPWVERRRSMDMLSRTSPDSTARGRLYLKVIAAQDLDFPFPSRDMEARCVLNEGTYEHTSPSRRLGRNTEFGHEFKLETHDFLDFTITIHVKQPDADRSTTLSRILSTQRKSRAEGLSKYINNEDGALAQVRISFQDIMSECQSKICTATFHLVNGWYKDAGLPLIATRNRMARRPIREKVVGKLIVKLAYLPGVDPQRFSLPPSLEACEEALNIRRWHETSWHTGYMSQLGGDLMFWRRRFFKLVGGRLYSHTDTKHSLRSVIDLAKAEIMTVDHAIVAHSQEPHVLEMIEMLPPTDNDLHPHIKPGSIMSSQMSISSESTNQRLSRNSLDSDSLYCSVKNSIRITFSNGEHMDFFCDSSKERKQWVDVLKVIVGRVPEWPEWLTEGREVLNQ